MGTQDKAFLIVLAGADGASYRTLASVLETVAGCRCLAPDASPAALGEALGQSPGLVAALSESEDWGMLRQALLLGAIDGQIRPTADLSALIERVREKNEAEDGVFSPRRTEAARALLYGGESDLAPSSQPEAWVAVAVEVVPRGDDAAVSRAVDLGLAGSSALGIREYDQEQGVLRLSLLFRDRPARVEHAAASQTRKLTQLLADSGAWVASGLGTVAGTGDVAGSLHRAKLALGYALVRGPGVHAFLGDREVAGLPCPDLAGHADQFVSRIQQGGEWHSLVDGFFTALSACSSVRRLHQEVQNVFSVLADLVPISPQVERYYHIADFVHGPSELRGELEALCLLAAEAVRTNGRSLAERKLQEFREYIAAHYADWRLDLALVCSALQISPSYLSKILRRSLHTAFVEYVTEVRMERSRELLSGTDLLTSQIAEQIGYVYTHYFSATFKKRYGTTPSEFRASCRARALESAAV